MAHETTVVFPKASLSAVGWLADSLRGNLRPGCQILASKKLYDIDSVKHAGVGHPSFAPRQTFVRVQESKDAPAEQPALVTALGNLQATKAENRFFFVDQDGNLLSVPSRVNMANKLAGAPLPGDIVQWDTPSGLRILDVLRVIYLSKASETRLVIRYAIYFLKERPRAVTARPTSEERK